MPTPETPPPNVTRIKSISVLELETAIASALSDLLQGSVSVHLNDLQYDKDIDAFDWVKQKQKLDGVIHITVLPLESTAKDE